MQCDAQNSLTPITLCVTLHYSIDNKRRYNEENISNVEENSDKNLSETTTDDTKLEKDVKSQVEIN